ncbi:MAG TPA: hypothetical protein VFO95_16000 [Gemmatimonadales bacterium]|nr:hypothetical protein [Gemmatimonadales bacterium]
MEDILAIILLFGGGTLGLLAFSPVGKAIAERIRGGRVEGIDPEVLSELDQLRHDVVELQERVDFTERLLAQQRDTAQLGGREKGALP